MCIAVLEKVEATLDGKAKKDKLKIEAAIESFCAKKDISQQDKKLVRAVERGECVWLGRLTGLQQLVVKWLGAVVGWLV